MKGKLIMTVSKMQDHSAWLEMRNKGIGGSEAAVVIGMSKWKSPFQLWLEKTGQVEPEDISDKECVYWGNVLEQAVADRFSELTGKKVRKQGMLQDEQYPFIFANVDRWVIGENAGLECKTTNAFNKEEWEGDNIPDSYYCQCQWYMGVTGAERWYIACLIGGQNFVWKEVARCEEDITALRNAVIDFWNKVENNIMPAVDGSEDCKKALSNIYEANHDLSIALPHVAEEAIENYIDVKNKIKELEEIQTLYQNQIMSMLGEAEIGTVGEHKVTWKQSAARITVDSKKLKAEYPDIYKVCSKVGKPSRIFKIAK